MPATKQLARSTVAVIALGALSACQPAPRDPESQPRESVATSSAPAPGPRLPRREPPVATPDSVAVWVPRLAPDTIPAWVFAPENREGKLLSCAAGDYVRNVVTVAFYLGTTRKQKEAAIRAAGGVVIGGSEFAETDGFYWLKVDPGHDGEGLCRADDVLRAFPQVILAMPVSFIWKGGQAGG